MPNVEITESPITSPEAVRSPERLTYNKAELGRAVGLSPQTIAKLEKKGLLRPLPGIRHKIFSVDEVRRFLAS